jgi:TolA-binding protein
MTRTHLVLVAALLVAAPAAAGAQNREHLQMTADVRMLQEQVAKLQLSVNQLSEALAAANKRIDTEAGTTQKGFADQQVALADLSETVNTVREKLQDNTVRVQQMLQELPSVRQGLSLMAEQLRTLVNLLQPGGDPGTAAAPSAAPPGPGAPAALGQVDLPDSPNAIFNAALGDYMSNNRMQNALEGFTEFVQKFPTAPQAPRAQFYVGRSYQGLGKFKEAIDAYGKVIQNYSDSDQVTDAYFEQGMCYIALNQQAQARRVFELLTTNPKYRDSSAAIQAAQRLKGMSASRN